MPEMSVSVRILVQLPAVLLILAFVPGNVGKLVALLALFAVTFGRLGKAEAILYLGACVFFTAMNAAALTQGIFAFTHPDILMQPVWELFMWGFYLLHTRRLLGGPAPTGRRTAGWALAFVFAAAFATIHDGVVLLFVTGAVLLCALALFHEPLDLAYAGYMVLLGALIEYTGVYSGAWAYPGDPPGGVPLWFVTMWGGVGLFLRRLIVPILTHYEAEAHAPAGPALRSPAEL